MYIPVEGYKPVSSVVSEYACLSLRMHSVGVPQLIVEKDPIRYDCRSSHCLVGTCCLVYTSADRATAACSVPPDKVRLEFGLRVGLTVSHR